MKTYARVAAIIATVILVSFLVIEGLSVPVLTDPSDEITRGGILAALLGGGLLLADVFIPVPSSIVMIAHGAAFGIAGGFLLSLSASVGGTMVGWWLGHRGSGWMNRRISAGERRRAHDFILRYGLVAIILSRMIPILSETVAILSGTTALGWQKVLLAAILGSIPPALIYAVAGSFTTDFSSGALLTVGVVLFAGAGWVLSRYLSKPASPDPAGCARD